MRAMRFIRPGAPLRCAAHPDPQPGPGQVVLRMAACMVCRTDLHLVGGELANPRPGVVPGHEMVGRVMAGGACAMRFTRYQRDGGHAGPCLAEEAFCPALPEG